MNGYANADTYNAVLEISNNENLYISARRVNNCFAMRNILSNAIEAGMIYSNIEIENVDFDEVLDAVLED
jgi:hypothetical protein